MQSCISLQEVAGFYLEIPLQGSSCATSSRMSSFSCSITASATVPGDPRLPSDPFLLSNPSGPTGPSDLTGLCGPTCLCSPSTQACPLVQVHHRDSHVLSIHLCHPFLAVQGCKTLYIVVGVSCFCCEVHNSEAGEDYKELYCEMKHLQFFVLSYRKRMPIEMMLPCNNCTISI